MLAELKYAQSEEGKAEKARKKAEAAAKKEVKQSTTDFLNMSFTPPKKDIVEMMTPNKEPISTAITPYRENKSFLDFVMGGSSHKTEQQLKTDMKVKRLKELKHNISKPKQLFEYNDLKTEVTGQPNPNQEIGSSMINRAVKAKLARNELETKKQQKKSLGVLSSAIKSRKARKDYKEAQDTYDPVKHQENVRDKRKEYTRIITTQGTTPQAKEIAQKKLNKTDHVFKRKSNAGRPPTNSYTGLKQTEL